MSNQFYLWGEDASTAIDVEVDLQENLDSFRHTIAGQFAIVEPSGIDFLAPEGHSLASPSEIVDTPGPIAISIDGKKVREAPAPKGLPFVGNYYEIFPDHLGNHQRLFDHYGAVFKTTNMGRTTYHTNDPEIATIVFSESDFFTKLITTEHPLYGIKQPTAGIFLGDTDTEDWRVAHKFLPPAFGPKAVRHYAPTMQRTVEKAFDVFDELDKNGEAWNVYQHMLKLGSEAVGKLVLGMDFGHFESVDAPIHRMVLCIAESLELNKKVTSMGDWYAALPFGDPKRLRNLQGEMERMLDEVIAQCAAGGTEDLELQEAALKATCVIDYAVRAVDSKGERLPKKNLTGALVVATGAGFTTTSSLLSWLIYGLVTYDGMQERLLQELVDAGIDEDTQWDADTVDKLPFLVNYIKEMQRRHNPSFQPARTAKVDLVLPGGYKIPKGAVVVPALHHIHNNPKLWDNPAKFDPDRWETESVKNRHRGTYLPFATGPRGCIGFNFALQEVRIFLPKLVYRYHFTKVGDDAVEYDPMFQLIRPVNLYVRAERRQKWPPRSEAKA
ncbi:Cytochrome P450 4F8 [Lasiodiplodia hormozganensis]|uniref:Cytochrome P450 4F8 n=1 Tax=Lasiodiplodia hormozganensis TaxID=869390 RepID=A0AA39U185_9PEZI|nr:Cytochrome p450 [Lasiodiplodia theobromae]KAF4544366.1 Cytochrome p450 [Lasiodiplodia theobromae]KAK0609044.1 Cytochrome P450 4F8 [Lasiodiplodia hormozganensis]